MGQAEKILLTATHMADTIRGGNVIHAFATGHSRTLSLELSSRAGGLVPVNMIAVKDLVMWGGWDPRDIMDPKVEREARLAGALLEVHSIEKEDLFIVGSHSGRNASVVEMAHLARTAGHVVIGITSASAYKKVPSRHPSGKSLSDIADVVIDTGVPYGDASLPVTNNLMTGGVSSLVSVFLAQALTVETIGLLAAAGDTIPIYQSANLPGGDRHNDRLLKRYLGRIRPIEP